MKIHELYELVLNSDFFDFLGKLHERITLEFIKSLSHFQNTV